MSEDWRPVVGWEGLYEVSSLGRVCSVPRQCVCRRIEQRIILATALGGRANNYMRVMLTRMVDGKRIRRHAFVHHLVAEAFIGPRPDGMVVCHKNDNGFENTPDNIVYGDRDTNELDRHVASVHAGLEEAPF